MSKKIQVDGLSGQLLLLESGYEGETLSASGKEILSVLSITPDRILKSELPIEVPPNTIYIGERAALSNANRALNVRDTIGGRTALLLAQLYDDTGNEDAFVYKIATITIREISSGGTDSTSLAKYSRLPTDDELIKYFEFTTNVISAEVHINLKIRLNSSDSTPVYDVSETVTTDNTGLAKVTLFSPVLVDKDIELFFELTCESIIGTNNGNTFLPNYSVHTQKIERELIATRNWTVDNTVDKDVFTDTKTYTGITEDNDIILSNTATNVILTTSGFDYHILGKKYNVPSTISRTVTLTEGLKYIYLDNTGNLKELEHFDADTLFVNNAIVACVYYSVAQSKIIYCGMELHTSAMPPDVHSYLHEAFWSRHINGGTLEGFSIGDGSVDEHFQFGHSSGEFRDEDLKITYTSKLPINSNIPIYYRIGINDIRVKDGNSTPFLGMNDISVTSNPKYNLNTNGVWSIEEVPDNHSFMVHYFETNDVNSPVIGVCGISVHLNPVDATDATYNEHKLLSGLPFAEFTPLGTVLFKTDGYANTEHTKILEISPGVNYVDHRGVDRDSSTSSPLEHNNLLNRDTENAHASSAVSYDNSVSNSPSDNVQGAIDDLYYTILNPTWVAAHSTDTNITYGGFKTTGIIRERTISTGEDKFFQSASVTPIPTELDWADWQNRETLIYS